MPDEPNANPTAPVEAPLPNTLEARTPDGTLRDQSNLQPNSTPTPTPETKPEDKPAEQPKAPEAYAAFKAPDGVELDKDLLSKATPIFKELNLPQDSAQKLVDLFNDYTKTQGDAAMKAVTTMREGWRAELNKDPELGGKLEQMKADIGKMKDLIFEGDRRSRDEFEAAMNLTGAGDHTAIIRGWYRAAQRLVEGTHVSGSGPSPHGQAAPNSNARPTLAEALYPNLPSA